MPTPAQLAFLRELADDETRGVLHVRSNRILPSNGMAALFSKSRRGTRNACRARGWVIRDSMLDSDATRYRLSTAGRAVLRAAEPPADIAPEKRALYSALRGSVARDRIAVMGPAVHEVA